MLTARLAARYTLARLLGSGTHGEVWLAHANDSNARVGIKISAGAKAARFARQELAALRALSHPNILPVLDADEDEENVYIVSPYIEGGDLLNYLRHQRAGLSESLARRIFSQILAAVDYAHHAGYLHRDIKLENILIDPVAERAYLIDWCFSGTWSPDKLQSGAFGSIHYSAPEICRGSFYIGPEVDVWSLGVVLFALNASKLPFRADCPRKIMKRILIASPTYPDSFSTELVSLLSAMLNPDRSLRATTGLVAHSPYMTGSVTPRVADDSPREGHQQILVAS